MAAFEVVVLGVGDTFSARHVTTSLLLRAGGTAPGSVDPGVFHLAVDCPDRYLGVLRAAAERSGCPLDPTVVDDLLLTHVHGDHMNGLEGLAFFKHFVEGKRLRLHTPPEVRADLWDGRLVAPMGRLWDGAAFRAMRFEDYFDHAPLDFDAPPRAIGPFLVRARRTVHHVPTCAILVEHDGRTLGYSADTAFDPSLIEWLSAADVIIHETNFGPAHTPYHALAALPEALRRKMRLIHYPDSFDLAASTIAPLREGEVLTV